MWCGSVLKIVSCHGRAASRRNGPSCRMIATVRPTALRPEALSPAVRLVQAVGSPNCVGNYGLNEECRSYLPCLKLYDYSVTVTGTIGGTPFLFPTSTPIQTLLAQRIRAVALNSPTTEMRPDDQRKDHHQGFRTELQIWRAPPFNRSYRFKDVPCPTEAPGSQRVIAPLFSGGLSARPMEERDRSAIPARLRAGQGRREPV